MTAAASEAGKKKKKKGGGLFDDFNMGKLCGSVAVGAVLGGTYSVFDQTILHKRRREDELPYMSDFLRRHAPDIVKQMIRFYRYRNVVANQREKQVFRYFTIQVLRQSEHIVALYNQVMMQPDAITPDMQVISLFHQMKDHNVIVVQYLRSMLALIDRDDDVDVEHAFNALYEAYHNRLFNIESKFR